MCWGDYWKEDIILEFEWKGQWAHVRISNPAGGGLNHFALNVNGYHFGCFERHSNGIDARLYHLFYSDDILYMVELINEKNGENLPFGKFYLEVPFHTRHGRKKSK